MTTPAPAPELLLTKEKLSVWAQERPLLDLDFADLVLDAVSTLLWTYGDEAWTAETIPKRARDIGYIVARNYYKNPDLLRSETTGPITETRAEAVLQGVDLSDDQKAELAQLATTPATGDADGLWAFSFSREPQMYAGRRQPGNIVLWDTRAGWPIEYLHPDDAFAFGLDE